jgi:hypothetical protein
MLERFFAETSRSADGLCQGGGSPAMALLPWQGLIHDHHDVPDQNSFDMRSR